MTVTPSANDLLDQLRALSNTETLASQTRFGIVGHERLGVSIYDLRRIAKSIQNHNLALELWQTGIHEARILASMVDDPVQVTLAQLEEWVVEFDSWDLCDIVTDELFIHAPDMLEVIPQWAVREEEYVKRASFAMIAAIVVHRKDVSDDIIRSYFSLIETAADDNRNFVKKAVNWALRNIGKWKPSLRSEAIACANRVLSQDSPSARWIAKDALREFIKKFGVTDEI
ncbi:MAG: DNA alkylation repair protein [Chloroflexi bacterium HGW-Chloroflexi-5]|jgi:3-methyladenine DNA glycosylase AlkD|nr:MAG: DNA alkylation repair protein [Chloroflexi bacterium HGW-Chloroflexi-5]